jgi:hypothetical protein
MWLAVVLVLLALVAVYLWRLWSCLPSARLSISPTSAPISCLVIFGSGGHTTEMLRIIQRLNIEKYSPLYFVLAQVSGLIVVNFF